MRYLTFSSVEHASYQTCILVPQLDKQEMVRHYIEPHMKGLEDTVLAYDLFREGKKTKAATMREYLGDLLPILADMQVSYLVVCDGDYFKLLTKSPKIDRLGGYVLDAAPEFGTFKVIYCPNFRAVFYDPEKTAAQISQAFVALRAAIGGTYDRPGKDVIHFEDYPQTYEEIRGWLQKLLDMDVPLAIDIEAFSLKHYEAGIGTISFAWNKNEGIAFPVDYVPIPGATCAPYGKQVFNGPVRALLREFFLLYSQTAHWHNIAFDVTVLIYQLFMKDLLDTEGLLEGLEVMLENWECTQLITYLATNSCSGNVLSLKNQSQEHAGDYGLEEINDITAIPLPLLLTYNLVDALSTWFVKEKHYDTMVQDEQLEIYETLFKPATVDIVQMQLTGLPIDMPKMKTLNAELEQDMERLLLNMQSNAYIEGFNQFLRSRWRDKMHGKWKKKRIELADVPVTEETTFNPNSSTQLQILLYDRQFMDLPVLGYTDTGLPETGRETLEALRFHTKDPTILAMLELLIEHSIIAKVLSAFMPHFLAAPMGPDGWHYLFGSLKLGGTRSGRLSSNSPNLQNLPAKGKLAKRIKECFSAPPGWLFCGLDFASLEDRISALTTKDPNKLKVYLQGFDGHCLRAFTYFSDQMLGIDPDSVESINSIKKLYPTLRDESKAPTFLLTYRGSYHGLMKNCGFSEELAKKIEADYHQLYRVSDEWVQERLQQASKDGYVTVAFGLRLRTPKLKQVILGTRKTPREAEAEGRTAGNAMGQSYGLLNTRAGVEFNRKVRASKHRLDIRPCVHIHDAQYFLIRDAMEPLLFTNEHLVKAVEWQEDPLIQHDEVKLGGELSVFYPNWACEMTVPNHVNSNQLQSTIEKHLKDLEEAAQKKAKAT